MCELQNMHLFNQNSIYNCFGYQLVQVREIQYCYLVTHSSQPLTFRIFLILLFIFAEKTMLIRLLSTLQPFAVLRYMFFLFSFCSRLVNSIAYMRQIHRSSKVNNIQVSAHNNNSTRHTHMSANGFYVPIRPKGQKPNGIIYNVKIVHLRTVHNPTAKHTCSFFLL